MTSISVLTLDSDDIKNRLNCTEKRVHQIMGMAYEGKFTDLIIDDFWRTIDACDVTLDTMDEAVTSIFEKLGRNLEDSD